MVVVRRNLRLEGRPPEMIYLGVDIHKENCWVTVLEAKGREREQQKLSMERGKRNVALMNLEVIALGLELTLS